MSQSQVESQVERPGPVNPGIKYALFLIVRQTKVLNICRLRVDCARKCHRSVKASAYPRIFRALTQEGKDHKSTRSTSRRTLQKSRLDKSLDDSRGPHKDAGIFHNKTCICGDDVRLVFPVHNIMEAYTVSI